jgi:glycosyltransferase involved in cell wall biosynthesis
MRVALLTNFVPPYRIPLYQRLRDRVQELGIYISIPMEQGRSWPPTWADLPVTVQRTITWHQVTKHPGGFSERSANHFPTDTLAQLDLFRPDVVITGELGMRSVLASMHCLRRRGTGLVLWATVSERSEASRGRLRHLIRRWLVRQADAVIVNGASGARYMVALGASPEDIVQMPYSMDLPAFDKTATRSADIAHRLLHVGQINERKGVMLLLRALARHAAANPNRRLEIWFAGDGPQRSAVETASWPSNLSIRLLGHVPYGELREIYAQGGIHAFPTLSDEWGMVVNEAMAAGLPVLGSIHAQAVEELVRDGVTGWVFDPVDPASLDRAVDRAMATPASALDAMRARTIDAVAHITPDLMADRMIEACRMALGSSRLR